jgi:hypothetical protein
MALRSLVRQGLQRSLVSSHMTTRYKLTTWLGNKRRVFQETTQRLLPNWRPHILRRVTLLMVRKSAFADLRQWSGANNWGCRLNLRNTRLVYRGHERILQTGSERTCLSYVSLWYLRCLQVDWLSATDLDDIVVYFVLVWDWGWRLE